MIADEIRPSYDENRSYHGNSRRQRDEHVQVGREQIHGEPQKSKLIILRIIRTPNPIQTAAAARTVLPMKVVNSSEM